MGTTNDLISYPDGLDAEDYREKLEEDVSQDHRVLCPTCLTVRGLDKRKIGYRIARWLLMAWWIYEDRWFDPNDLRTRLDWWARDDTTAKHWGLIEKLPGETQWRLTQRGIDFVEERISIAAIAIVSKGHFKCYSGKQIKFSDCLKKDPISKTRLGLLELWKSEGLDYEPPRS